MKKRILLLVALMALLLVGCKGRGTLTEEPTPEPTMKATPMPTPKPTPTSEPEPTPTPEPPTEPGTASANGIGVLYTTLQRGDTVTVVGETDDCYVADMDGVQVLFYKQFLRLDGREPYEAWNGYARSGAPVYANAYREGDTVAELSLNTEVAVADQIGDILFIRWVDGSGYVPASEISESMIYYSSGGSGGGGSSGEGADGGDIQLSLPIREGGIVLLATHSESAFVPTGATVLADHAEAYLAILLYGDAVRILDEADGVYRVLLNGNIGTIPAQSVRRDSTDTEPYAQWEGFAAASAPFYTDYRMLIELRELSMNTKLTVLSEFDDCYLVSVDGELGYIPKDEIKDTEYYYSGGGGGGESGGESGGEWTEPAL